MKQNNGFTLIELIVVVVIVAILAAIAIPSYNAYLRQSRRTDAKDALLALQFAEEKYRGNNTEYSSDPSDLGLTSDSSETTWTSPQGYYVLTITSASATTYAATATVDSSGAQSADATDCPALSINQAGFIVDDTASCWGLQ